MNTCAVGGHTVKLYDSIDEMPMANYHRFNKYIIFDSGLAPDANGVIGHLSRMNELLNAESYDKLRIELQNTYQAINFIMNDVSPVSMAFACMVYSIDGEEVTDLSDEALKLLSYRLNREKARVLRSKVEEFKKKLNLSLKAISKPRFRRARKRERQLAL